MLRSSALLATSFALLAVGTSGCAESRRFGPLPPHAETYLLFLTALHWESDLDLDGGRPPRAARVDGIMVTIGPQDSRYEGEVELTWGTWRTKARYVGVDGKLVLVQPRPWVVRDLSPGSCDDDSLDPISYGRLDALELSFGDRDGDGIAESATGSARGELVRGDGRYRLTGRFTLDDAAPQYASVALLNGASAEGEELRIGAPLGPVVVSLSPMPAHGTVVSLRVGDQVVPLEERPAWSYRDTRRYELPPHRRLPWDAPVELIGAPALVDVFGRAYAVPSPIRTERAPPSVTDGTFETNRPPMSEIVTSFRDQAPLEGQHSFVLLPRSVGSVFRMTVPPGATRLVLDARFFAQGPGLPPRPTLSIALVRDATGTSASFGPVHDVAYPSHSGVSGAPDPTYFTDPITIGAPIPAGTGSELVVRLHGPVYSMTGCGDLGPDVSMQDVGALVDRLRFE